MFVDPWASELRRAASSALLCQFRTSNDVGVCTSAARSGGATGMRLDLVPDRRSTGRYVTH